MTTSAAPLTRPDSAAEVLRVARDRRTVADAAEAELPELAVSWAVLHPAESVHGLATHTLRGFGETDLPLAGPGAPTVAEFCVAESRGGGRAAWDSPRSRRVRPRQVVLHVHLSEQALRGHDPVARLERGDTLVSAQQVRTWCGPPTPRSS